MSYDMYLYGMILRTNSFLLEGDYPEADTYAEIRKKYSLPGGETGTCATVLLGLGRSVKMDGTFMGKSTMPFIKKFYEGAPCDLSGLHLDETFDGLEDNVLVVGNTRTPFGEFRKFYSDPVHRWNAPKAEDIAGAKVAGIDPYFREDSVRAAEMCREMGKPYVTIDCAYDSPMHRLSAVNVVSNEFYREHYKQDHFYPRRKGNPLRPQGRQDSLL